MIKKNRDISVTVISRTEVYVNGMIARHRVDKKVDSCRYVWLCNNVYVKIDEVDRDWVGCQSLRELSIYNKMSKDERKFFVRPISWGIIRENQHKIYWVAQKRVFPIKGKILEGHPNYDKFLRICKKYYLCDCDDVRNSGIDKITGQIICWDYGA